MKNLTNILSYLCLLLLLLVAACSDLEEIVVNMQGEEEVELTIQLHVPDMQASTRAQMEITEKISTIVAIAFDGSDALIKKVNATLTPANDYQGTLKIKVPKRTQTIHFLGNYTKDDIGSITSLETLNSFTTTDVSTMRYWGKATYNGGNELSEVTLTRNMAKLTLKKGEGFTANSCYIAGFVNRNLSGTIVPSGYSVGDIPTIPNNVSTETHQADNSLGNVYYLFEHANDKNNKPLYVIIEVADKYYKVAFAAGDEYFPIIRNHEYTITIDGIDAMYAEADYPAAVNSQCPINDLVITSVPMTVTPYPSEVQNESGQTFTVDVTIPEGITELNVPTHDAFDITPRLTPQNGKYTVTQGGTYEFTFTVKEGVEAGNKTISFSGQGKYKSATGSATVNLYEMVLQITAALTPQITSLNYSANSVSDLIVNVTIPAGVTTLNFSSDYFDVEFINSTSLTDNGNGSYTVTGGDTISADARLRLKNKTATQNAGFTFSGTGEGVMVTPATINNITLQASGDENVRWQGNVDLSYKNDARKIVLPYSWFSSVQAGSKLRVEYEILSTDGPIIQFSEVEGEKWDEPGFHFPELETTTNNGKIGCNLSDKKSDTGYWIYGTNESAFTGSASFDLTLSQDVLTALADNRRPNLFGGEDIVIAIQGENVRLKKISVIPNNNPVTGNILVALPNGTAQSAVSTTLDYASGESSLEEFTVDVTVPAGVTQINIAADDFDVRTEPTSTITTYSFEQSAEEQTKRFKFTLKANNKSDKNSTITISDNSGNATSATVTVDLSPRAADANGKYTVWSGLMDLEWTRNYLAVNSYLPIGTKVTLNFTSSAEGGSFEMHDCNETVFRLNGVSYPEGDDWISVGNGTNNYQFEITNQTTIKDSNGNYVAIQNPINGLRINGTGLIMTSIVVDYSGVTGETFGYDFDKDSMDGMNSWGNISSREIVTEDGNESNKVLKLTNPSKVNSWEAQVAFDRIFVPGNYTLTYRIKGDATGTIDQGFQYSYDPIETNTQFKNASDYPQTNVTTEWQIVTIQFSVTRACNRFLLNIGQFVGNIYIEYLTLEKN